MTINNYRVNRKLIQELTHDLNESSLLSVDY